MNFVFLRNISTSVLCHKTASVSINKQVNVMKKIMAGREKGKRRWILNENMPKLETAKNISSTHGQSKSQARRVVVLNKLFMKNISDLMATEAFAKNILGFGIQITNVRMSVDFKAVNVFWLANSDDKDIIVQEILNSIAGPMRHELSQLRLMGEVPRIYFVRDNKYSKAIEIDSILKTCDFGEDFTPTDPTLFLRKEPAIEMQLSDEIRKKIEEIDENLEAEVEENELPKMKNDIFGLDHDRIMKKISTNIDKTKRAWESFETKQTIPFDVNERDMSKVRDEINQLNAEAEARKEFAKFLTRKQFTKATPERKKHQNLIPQDDEVEDTYDQQRYEIVDDDFYEEYDDTNRKN